jgi:DNA-binding IclR family transcriptional regulator
MWHCDVLRGRTASAAGWPNFAGLVPSTCLHVLRALVAEEFVSFDAETKLYIIVVAVSQSGQNIQLTTQIGSRFPALIGATGRCIAAFGDHSEAELEARFKTLRWDEPPTLDEWKAQVSQTRVRGFAVDAGNYISGVTVVAAPVWKTRATLSHALVAIGIGSALKRAGLPAPQEALLSAAKAL